jgi:phenylalanyl-tRNA synthetase beta subunit
VKTTKERSTNSRGIRYITLRSTDKKRDVRTTDATLVDKGVVYALHCVYKAQEKPMAISEARLHEWAQQFGG